MEPRRRIRASYKQLSLFVKFMKDNPNLAKGVNCRTAFGKHYHDAKWTELANLLNAQENGMKKSPREWNRYWKDLKSGIKKKVQAMKKQPGHKKVLSSIERVIYKNLCSSRSKKNVDPDDKQCSYLQIPESDYEQDQYEVEYLDDTCDETQMTNIACKPEVNIIVHSTLNDVKSNLLDTNGQPSDFTNQDNFIIETILNGSNSTEQSNNMAEERTLINNDVNVNDCDTNFNLNTSTNDSCSTDVLTDIRNHLKELVGVQKDRARSELRLAQAHERRAILEERRVRIEERRLKIEERRVALDERKMEALEKRSFAHERLASAAERKNEIAELRMANSEFVLR